MKKVLCLSIAIILLLGFFGIVASGFEVKMAGIMSFSILIALLTHTAFEGDGSK